MATAIVPSNSSSEQTTRRTILVRLATGTAVAGLSVAAVTVEVRDPFPELERQFWHYYRWEGLPRDMEEDDPRIEAYSDGWQATAAAIIATVRPLE